MKKIITKKRVIEVLGELVDVALNTNGIDDDMEYITEILATEEYIRMYLRGSSFEPDQNKLKKYIEDNVGTGI